MDNPVGGSVDISIRSYDEQILDAYSSLFPDDPQKSPELLDWRFQANPHGPAKFAVAAARGEIVGMIALVPTRLVGSKAGMTGYQAIDTVVHPSFHGRGLFVRMGAAAQDKQALGGSVLF
jgi:GNAT superfamily N-acetyltransferase